MTVDWFVFWFWPAVVIAFLGGAQLSRWWIQRSARKRGRVNTEYFKGLNFLLNEEPDKAIEVFIKALEVDSETVELHLALGGLFRRKGQVDRATRIHQNLIARPSLTAEQRLQAIYELAQDYYKAGLLDRAEGLFIELRDTPLYRAEALEGLCRIYQQEREWIQAIEVTRLHKRQNRQDYVTRTAHYWCELAEDAINNERFDDAKKYLRSSLQEDRSLARAILLRGELHYRQRDYRRALDLWETLADKYPMLASLMIGKAIDCFQALNDNQGLRRYLLETAIIPREQAAFQQWLQTLELTIGKEGALQHLFQRVRKEGLSGPVARYLFQLSDQSEDSMTKPSEQEFSIGLELRCLVRDLLSHAKEQRIEYTCKGCGFNTRSHFWLCPNCGEWDSFAV